MDIYNASISSVEFCIYNETDSDQAWSLYPGGPFSWASISPGAKFSWNHENRDKVRIEFRFTNNKRATYVCWCNPGVTIKPGMDIATGISVPAQFDVKNEIKHIVVLMLENRSFDNVLGWLYADQNNRPQLNIPAANPPTFEGLSEKKFFNTRYAPGSPPVYATKGVTKSPIYNQPNPNPNEDYPSFLEQMFRVDLHGSWPTGSIKLEKTNMAGFLESYAREDKKAPERIMESYSPEQLPVISQLAKQFAVCDRWFGSIPSETLPNRSFLHAGTSFGRLNNGDKLTEEHDPVPNFAFYCDKRTVFDVLSEQAVSWKVYQDLLDGGGPLKLALLGAQLLNLRPSLTSMQFWSVLRKISLSSQIGYFAEFEQGAKAGNLPGYSFIEPAFLPPFTSDQHPGPFCDMLAGDDLIYRTYLALSQGPAWRNTLLIILYDEHGGCYDHVPPPNTAVPPDNSTPQFQLEGFSPFRQFGPRVPVVVVSPFIEPGTVFRSPQGQTEYDHTSVLATIRDWVFRGAPPAPSAWLPSERVKVAPTLWGLLTRTTPRPAPAITARHAGPARDMAMELNVAESLQSSGPEAPPDLGSMTSLQLGLAIEAHARQSAINNSPTGTLENIDPETWQRLLEESADFYRKKVKSLDSP